MNTKIEFITIVGLANAEKSSLKIIMLKKKL